MMGGRGGLLVTDEAIEETAGRSDTEIACQLVRGGYILHAHFEVWQRSRQGESIYSMRKDYPNEARGGTFYASTLHAWVLKVDKAITEARQIDAPLTAERSPFGISVADGHKVRRAADTTPEGRKPRSMFPDADRLRAVGKLPR